jgi:glycine/D-amino acid oxidase-like deaminating enzyme
MRTCDVAIIGLGLMGSSALHSLSGRGADVLGFDPLIAGEARGSSHGSWSHAIGDYSACKQYFVACRALIRRT